MLFTMEEQCAGPRSSKREDLCELELRVVNKTCVGSVHDVDVLIGSVGWLCCVEGVDSKEVVSRKRKRLFLAFSFLSPTTRRAKIFAEKNNLLVKGEYTVDGRTRAPASVWAS